MPRLGSTLRHHDLATHRVSCHSLDAGTINAALLRDVALMRSGPWTFQIVGLYVWLCRGSCCHCLAGIRYFGWRPLLALSWFAYLGYHVSPITLTGAEFESSFPILAWQLLFVHGIVIGYHREQLASAVCTLCHECVPVFTVGAAAAFTVFAFCNPRTEGPSWLQLSVVSPERFTYLYFKFFELTDLGIGRLLNLAGGAACRLCAADGAGRWPVRLESFS